MGTVDKGLVCMGGKPMVAHVIERLGPQVATLAINANQNHASYARYGYPVWPDALPDFAGPLAGLQTGLMHCTTGLLVTAPCDSPFLPPDLVAQLARGLHDQDADVTIAVTYGADGVRQPHPVFCLAKTSLLGHLTHYLQTGGRKVEHWTRSLKLAEVVFADANAFRNINTRAELDMQDGTLAAGSTP